MLKKKHNRTKSKNKVNKVNNSEDQTQASLLSGLMKDKQKIEKIHKLVSPNITYTTIKYKSDYFTIGDKIVVFANNENLIGELIKIIPVNGMKQYPCWPTIQVRWYYKKYDLNRKKNNLIDEQNYAAISDYELFETKHKDIIFIESVLSKCEIYSYEDYEALEDHTDKTFFCRAKYDPTKQLLEPSFDKWKKGCVCQKPLNPDQLYIKCDSCNGWFHPTCCGIKDEDADKLKKFICPLCSKK